MIRVVIFLAVIGLLAFGAVWLADRPGDVAITWQGWRVETSLMVLAAAVAIVAALAVLLWSATRAILRTPDILWLYLRSRRGVRGYHAVSQGLIAIGSGDARAARRYAEEASRIAPTEPLTLLLSAQASQLGGDRAAAERTFHVMAGRDDTKLLGLHGLFIEAQRRDDMAAARLYAEEAAKGTPAPAWAGHAVLDFRCAMGDWTGALERLDRNLKSGLVDKVSYRRQRAVLLTARALEAEASDRNRARTFALEAIRFAPTLVPAAALAGQLLGEAGELRKAGRIVETAWRANPHPDLAETFAHLRPGDSARDRLRRVETLAEKSPGNVEAALAVARAALDAREFAIARKALVPLAIVPTQRVALLMAELEELEHGDEGRAREWMGRAVNARRDPAWTADGVVSDRWMPVSPVTGRLDAFEWRDPLAELGGEAALIEGPREERAVIVAPPAVPPSHADAPALELGGIDAAVERAPAELPALRRMRRTPPSQAGADKPFEKLIPLVHVPDDPGPDPEQHPDPQTEPQRETASEGWRILRGLFNK